jgi:hypothetical protein
MGVELPEEWLALAEQIEKATGPNREIDARIFVALGRLPFSPWIGDVTHSLDAITALIEREFPGHLWAVLRREIVTKAMLDQPTAKDKIATSLTLRQVRTAIYANAETPALALCTVFCRAMAARVPSASPPKDENNV